MLLQPSELSSPSSHDVAGIVRRWSSVSWSSHVGEKETGSAARVESQTRSCPQISGARKTTYSRRELGVGGRWPRHREMNKPPRVRRIYIMPCEEGLELGQRLVLR